MTDRLARVAAVEPGGVRIRIHGCYRLGQVLRAGAELVELDRALDDNPGAAGAALREILASLGT